jgi:hypothetical protein
MCNLLPLFIYSYLMSLLVVETVLSIRRRLLLYACALIPFSTLPLLVLLTLLISLVCIAHVLNPASSAAVGDHPFE